jgi:predicted CXXCH cytochrome family protein
MRRVLLLLLLPLAACSILTDAWEGVEPLSATNEAIAVVAHVDLRVALDAVGPTDVQPLPDGGFAVLDGWGRRLLKFDASGQPNGIVVGSSSWGRPTRFQPIADGYLLADPGWSEAPGGVLRTSATGEVTALLHPSPAPVAVLVHGDQMLVADRTEGLRTCDLEAEKCEPVALQGYTEAEPMLTDLVPLPGGGFVATEPLGSRVHLFGEEAAEVFGKFGHHVGALVQPKGVAVAGEALLLVDSALGFVQLFDRQGRPLGPLVADGELIRLDHPLAARRLADGRFVLLAAGTPEVLIVSITEAVLADAPARADVRRLRTPLPAQEAGEADACRQCHDGFLNDSRANWDDAREHHPVGIVPERELPGFFPLDPEGRIKCGTCHSPHGVVDLDEAAEVNTPAGRAQLVRHKAAGKPMTRLETDGAGICLPCHEDSAHGGLTDRDGLIDGSESGHLFGDALREALQEREDGAEALSADCLGCHATHGAGSEPLLRAAELGATCLGCHAGSGRASSNHPRGKAFGADTPKPGASARLVLVDEDAIGCGTCHDVTDGQTPGLLREVDTRGPICLACHEKRRSLVNSRHGKIKGDLGIPCLGCHDVHGAPISKELLVPGLQEDTCLVCHGPGESAAKANVVPGQRGHPTENTGDGKREITGCDSCHDVHAPGDPRRTCADCHPAPAAASKRLGGHLGATCLDCHPIHDNVLPQPPSAANTNPAGGPCLSCHAEDARVDVEARVSAYSHPEAVFLPDGQRWNPLGLLPLFDAEGELLGPEENGSLSCRSCHRTHGGEPGDVEPLRRKGAVKSCSPCHGTDSLPLFRWFHDPTKRTGTEE